MWGDRRGRIRHEGPDKVWEQVANDITADIRSGALRSGARLPSHNDLADTYGVALVTIRRAMLHLRQRKIVRVVHGRGTYVA